mgnify:CR=1 FL=1|tara:strand:- start:31 stop:192 length:162 start_codon:yes stop_codon:yes gene_type:complete
MSKGQYAADFGGWRGILDRAYPDDVREQMIVEDCIAEIHSTMVKERKSEKAGS